MSCLAVDHAYLQPCYRYLHADMELSASLHDDRWRRILPPHVYVCERYRGCRYPYKWRI